MDFLIPSSIVSIPSFQHHQEIIYLLLGNILKYWIEIMQEGIATFFIFWCDNIPISQIPNCWTISKHLEKGFIIMSFLVPNITFILLYPPRENIALNNPCIALRKGGKRRHKQILDECTEVLWERVGISGFKRTKLKMNLHFEYFLGSEELFALQ